MLYLSFFSLCIFVKDEKILLLLNDFKQWSSFQVLKVFIVSKFLVFSLRPVNWDPFPTFSFKIVPRNFLICTLWMEAQKWLKNYKLTVLFRFWSDCFSESVSDARRFVILTISYLHPLNKGMPPLFKKRKFFFKICLLLFLASSSGWLLSTKSGLMYPKMDKIRRPLSICVRG